MKCRPLRYTTSAWMPRKQHGCWAARAARSSRRLRPNRHARTARKAGDQGYIRSVRTMRTGRIGSRSLVGVPAGIRNQGEVLMRVHLFWFGPFIITLAAVLYMFESYQDRHRFVVIRADNLSGALMWDRKTHRACLASVVMDSKSDSDRSKLSGLCK